MGEVQIATAVEAAHQELIALIAAAMPKAHQVQRCWCHHLEALILLYPFGKLLRYFYVPAHVVLESLHSVVPNHEPKLERTKTAAERDVPVAVVKDRARFGCLVAKVFGAIY